jgi:hypothetical protein
MRDLKDDGGPAYPVVALQASVAGNGMSLRDYFAGQAMAGFSSSTHQNIKPNLPRWELMAEDAYKMADAMIEARK